MSASSSLAAATTNRIRTVPTIESILEGKHHDEAPSRGQGSGALEALAETLRKPVEDDLTPLHVNVRRSLNQALKRAMSKTGLKKTEIVTHALTEALKEYL